MKKNKMMRTASVLLILVLLTTSIISGTFAKYVTMDTADDSARVAMFGVKIETEGSLFDKGYKETANTPGTASLSVLSSTTANVAAPGTKNTDGMVFSITGKPEVSVNVSITIDDDASDIWLGQGLDYPNMTTGDVFNTDTTKYVKENVTFMNGQHYYPIQYTLQKSATNTPQAWSTAEKVVEAKPLSAVVTYLQQLSTSASTTYAPGTDLSDEFGYYKLTWEWAFDGPQTLNGQAFSKENVDMADTLLGDLAAQTYGGTVNNNTIVADALNALKEASGGAVTTTLTAAASNKTQAYMNQYNLDALLNFTITVTQVD